MDKEHEKSGRTVDGGEAQLHEEVENPSSRKASVAPVKRRLNRRRLILMLNDGRPDPSPEMKRHHAEEAPSDTSVKRETLPVEEGAKDQIAENLDKGGDERGEGAGADGVVLSEEGADPAKGEDGVEGDGNGEKNLPGMG